MQVRLIGGDRPATWRDVDGQFGILAHGRVEIDDPERTYLVELDIETGPRGACCRRVALRARPGQRDIGTKIMREVQVPALVELAVTAFAGPLNDPERGIDGGVDIGWTSTGPDGELVLHLTDESSGALLDWAIAQVKASREASAPRSARITDDDLRQFAELVRLRNGRPYMQTVMDAMGLSPDQARKWKRKAVQRGYLEELE